MRICQQCSSPAHESDRFCATCGARLQEEGSSSSSDPLIGRTIGGSYTLQEIIGVGGMGRVYRAEQGSLGRSVAIKVIHPHLLGDEQTAARFYQEARAASRLNHPNSVSIIDFGRTEDGILYLAMEHLTGRDLGIVVHEEGPLPFRRVCEIMIAVLDALGEAHQLGIVHRDLKPENIILERTRSGRDRVKVVDFGLATIVGGETSITKPGLVCGTPDYMSPEQGRGDEVDGRGDLYSLGVMLFELLTDQLPYVDDTPTKVVLRHMNDVIPDPRETAPHRGIPDSLVEIVFRALQKDADERFADALAMQEAIRSALEGIRQAQSSRKCAQCGQANPGGMRFCGSCGSPLHGSGEVAASMYPTPSTSRSGRHRMSQRSLYPVAVSQRPLIGRRAEFDKLIEYCDRATGRNFWVRVDGEAGVGKTRLIVEAAEALRARGDVVVAMGDAHPSGAPVPYHAVKTVLTELLDVDPIGYRAVATEGHGFDALAQAGIDEVLEPRGLHGSEGEGRSGAVAAAVAAALVLSMSRTKMRRGMLVFDDLPRCDGLTQACIARLPVALEGISALLVTVGRERDGHPDLILLRGLNVFETGRFLSGKPEARSTPVESSPPGGALARRMLPLYLEQLISLGATTGEDALPPRLADAIGQRFDRLAGDARRLLQAAAVLGTEARLDDVLAMTDPAYHGALDDLLQSGLLVREDGVLRFSHVFVRELAEAFIPAGARRQLHEAALELSYEVGAPAEVIAEHAYRAGETMAALMALERMGDVALVRGDSVAAVLGYRRALEVARRELLETGDFMMDAALVTFSRKLGRALEREGDLPGADGVLREAVDLTAPASSDRARMLVALGRVSFRRDRYRDAMRHLGLALEIVAGVDAAIEAEVQMGIGRIRRAEGNAQHATIAFRRAAALFGELDDAAAQVRAQLELARALAASDRRDEALEAVGTAERGARAAEIPVLVAEALGVLGEIEVQGGDTQRAALHFRTAGRLAAEAGDAEGVYRYASLAASV